MRRELSDMMSRKGGRSDQKYCARLLTADGDVGAATCELVVNTTNRKN